MTKIKREKLAKLKTDVIRYILGSLSDIEALAEPTREYPLAGSVHISTIGQVPVKELRAELARRS